MFQSIINSILSFLPVEVYLEILSHVTTARFMQTYLFPLFLIFSVRQYVNVMIAAIISHISVICLKWILAGPRPYWWINETDLYSNHSRPTIEQSYLTCEPSAGNPSGHAMVTATILYILLRSLLDDTSLGQCRFNRLLKGSAWSAFVLILCGTTASRMYFGCHFFHQCFIGICCGITLSQLLRNEWLTKFLMEMSKLKALTITTNMGIFMGSMYFSHHVFGADPQWAVRKAFNWCTDPYSIRPESTPMYALCREFGLLLGLVFCAPFMKRIEVELSIKWSLPTVLAIMGLNMYAMTLIPRYNGAIIFFFSTMALHFAFTFVLLRAVSKLASKQIKVD